ncbi:MAG: hypothetical protein KDK36_13795 [Leptospiraceae bacterium]|nr:hypothetical protein [Leptospiraceae bacterium]
MSQEDPKSFLLDIQSFKKRIIIKYIILFLANLGILLFGFFSYSEDKTNYLLMSVLILILIILMFIRNGKRQLDILSKMYFEISGNLLKQHGANGSCTEIELDKIKSLKLDNLLGYKRILLKSEKGETHTYSRIIKFDTFIEGLENASSQKIQTLHRNKIKLLAKTIILYSPSYATYYLTRFSYTKLNMEMTYLILTLNTMFFIHNISERKFEGGISNKLARRLIIILFLYFLYQFYRIFYSGV